MVLVRARITVPDHPPSRTQPPRSAPCIAPRSRNVPRNYRLAMNSHRSIACQPNDRIAYQHPLT